MRPKPDGGPVGLHQRGDKGLDARRGASRLLRSGPEWRAGLFSADSVHLFGRCHPSDCDWGTMSGHLQSPDGRSLQVVYNQGFARKTGPCDIDTLANGTCAFTDFTDPARRDYNMTEIMRHP